MQRPDADGPRPRSPWPIVLVAAALVYGSLYPFDLVFPPPSSAWRRLATPQTGDLHLGDILANVLAFVPLGFFLARGATGPFRRLLPAIAFGAVLGVGLQVAQAFFPERVPSLWDAAWNTAGAAIGALIGIGLSGQRLQRFPLRAGVATALVLLWLATETFPFVPTLDWQALKDSLKPLLLHPALTASGVLANAIGWCALAHFWHRAFGPRWARAGPWLALLATLGAQVLIVSRAPSASGVLGGAAGVTLAAFPWRRQHLQWGLLLGLVVLLVATGLAPVVVREAPATFHWLPLAGFLEGAPLRSIGVGLDKVFWYGLMLELMRGTGWRPRPAIVVGIMLLGAIEWAQRWIGYGHVAEVTDPLILLCLGLLRAGWLRWGHDPTAVDEEAAPSTSHQRATGDGRHSPID